MKIAIIGSGKIASPLGRIWASKGHEIFYGSRSPNKLEDLLKQSGPASQAGLPAEAIGESEIAFEAIPFGKVIDLPTAELAGKTLISASNYFPFRDGTIEMNALTQTEWLSNQFPATYLVKAFSMIGSAVIESHANGNFEERYAMLLAGERDEDRKLVSTLIEEAGFDPVDFGGLPNSWMFESLGGPLFDARLSKTEAEMEFKRLSSSKP